MNKIKAFWQIDRNWQLIYLFLGGIGLLISGYMITSRILPGTFEDVLFEYLFIILGSIAIAFVLYYVCLFLFKKLRPKWNVEKRWEMIAIFIVFAITGSMSAQLSKPILAFLHLTPASVSPYVYWPLRILLIFPLYQVLLLIVAKIFGQYSFFSKFVEKMLSRLGIKLSL